MNEAETQLWRQTESLPCDNPNFGVSNGKECAVDHIFMDPRPMLGDQSETIAELLKLCTENLPKNRGARIARSGANLFARAFFAEGFKFFGEEYAIERRIQHNGK